LICSIYDGIGNASVTFDIEGAKLALVSLTLSSYCG